MRKTVLTFGLLSGIVLSTMMLLTIPFIDRIGFERGEIIGYTTMVAASLLIYFGIRRYRDTVAGGRVSFGRAFVVGALIAAVSSACYAATWQVVYFRLVPDFMTRYQAHAIEEARADGATPAELAQKAAEMEEFARMYRNPAINAAITFLEPLPVALLASLISARLLRRRPDARTAPGVLNAA